MFKVNFKNTRTTSLTVSMVEFNKVNVSRKFLLSEEVFIQNAFCLGDSTTLYTSMFLFG